MPEPKHPNREREVQSIVKEIFRDEGCRAAITFGIQTYERLIQLQKAALGEDGESDLTINETLKTIGILGKLLKFSQVFDQTPLQDRRSNRGRYGEYQGRVTLGPRPQEGSGTVKQLEIAVSHATPESIQRRLNDRMTRETPERLVTDGRSVSPTRMTILMKDRKYSPHGITTTASVGIVVEMDNDGVVTDVKAVTTKHGVPHYTDSLFDYDERYERRPFHVSEEALEAIHSIYD